MVISVASGKGGTGKTTVSTSLALSINSSVQFLDCDVEEPNAHLFLKPKIKHTETVSIPVPEVDEAKCDFCGKCAEICAYNAIAVLNNRVLVFSQLCHGCGGCALLCPKSAIREVNRAIGTVETGLARNVDFAHGRLNIGEAMSPPLIRAVKEHVNSNKTVIIDVPPGTSCPVVEAVKGSNFCVLVTEPTPFGLNDLALAVEVLKKINIPFGVVVNRYDAGYDKLDNYCKKENIPIMMRIPFSKEIARAYSKGIPVVNAFPEYKKEFLILFEKIVEIAK